MKLKLFYPHKPWFLIQKFGENKLPLYKELGMKGHNGEDAAIGDNMPVRAAHDGVVTYAGRDGSNGLLCVVQTEAPFDYAGSQCFFKTLYGHLKPGTFRVGPGDRVKTGDALAGADNTGASTGTHLHFGLKPVRPGEQSWQWFNLEQDNGYNGAIDPASYWSDFAAVDKATVISIIKNLIYLISALVDKMQSK